MKLSSAILLGSTMIQAGRGFEWSRDGAGCARGMALVAVGKRTEQVMDKMGVNPNVKAFYRAWPWTRHLSKQLCCPCAWVFGSVGDGIAHIFDSHVVPPLPNKPSVTIEQLADWVREQEKIYDPEPEEKEVEDAIQRSDAVRVA